MTIEILSDQTDVATRAAALMCDMTASAHRPGSAPFTVALSGGTTPKMLYKLLTSEPWKDRLPWKDIHWFIGDERNVPLDHKDSNFHLAKTELFTPAQVPTENQFPLPRVGIAPPEQVASDYEMEILEYVKPRTNAGIPRFDLIMLGVGTDGHTASLFPHTPALTPPPGKVVVANYIDKRKTWRITITPEVIRAAKNIILLVAGEDKAEALAHVLEGEDNYKNYPAQIARDLPAATWLIDKPAAAMLQK